MTAWLSLLLHAVLVAAASLILPALQARTVARWQGAEGPALDHTIRTLSRLWRKQTVLPAGASILFAAAPIASAAMAAVACLMIPSFTLGLATAPAADLLLIGLLLAASRLVIALAAWDAGSAVLVHAATRSMAARIGAGPVWLLVGFAALLLCGSSNLEAAILAVRDGGTGARLAGCLAGAALFALSLESPGSRLDPWSGRLLGLAELAGHLRAVAALGLVAALSCPFGLGAAPDAWAVGMACWVLKLGLLGLLAAACRAQLQQAGADRVIPVGAMLAMMAAVLAGLQGTA